MPYHNVFLPVPYIQINKEGHILSYSEEAKAYFNMQENRIHSLLDEDSISKLYKYSAPDSGNVKLELNMKTKASPIALFDVYVSWDLFSLGHLILIPKDDGNLHLSNQLFALQQRLATTDFELFEKKDELDLAMNRLNELSGPFIALSKETAFVPLFGDLTEIKTKAITTNTLNEAYNGQYDQILFDFTAVGTIEFEGVKAFHELLQMLFCMNGMVIKIIGVKPLHAQEMNKFNIDLPVYYDSSLKDILNEKKLEK